MRKFLGLFIVASVAVGSVLLAWGGVTTSDETPAEVADADDPYNCGGPYSKEELDAAWAHVGTASGPGSAEAEEGDWDVFVEHWGNLYTEDVTYHDHQVGIMHGREEIKAWMSEWMGIPPFDKEMVFEMEWVLMDYERSWVNYKLWNRMRDPGDGKLYQVALFTNLRYGGNNQWCYDEDIYNPAEMIKMVEAWSAAKAAMEGGGSTADSTGTGPVVCGGEECRELNPMVTSTRDVALCCTADDQCGVELIGCMPMDAPGALDESCPDSKMSGMLPVDGCCNRANQCGVVLDLLNLGCVENSTAAKIAMAPELTARACGNAPGTEAGG